MQHWPAIVDRASNYSVETILKPVKSYIGTCVGNSPDEWRSAQGQPCLKLIIHLYALFLLPLWYWAGRYHNISLFLLYSCVPLVTDTTSDSGSDDGSNSGSDDTTEPEEEDATAGVSFEDYRSKCYLKYTNYLLIITNIESCDNVLYQTLM